MCCKRCQGPFMEPGPFDYGPVCHFVLPGSVHSRGVLLGLSLHFYWDSTAFSNMFGEIIMPPAPGDGHNPARGFGSCGWERCWRCWPLWWTIPIRGHCSWMQFKEALGGCSKLTAPAILGDKESKKSRFEAMCSSAVPPLRPALPSVPGTYSPSHKPSFDTEKNLAKHGKKNSVFELSICWVKCPNPLQPPLWTVKQSMQKPRDPSWAQGSRVSQNKLLLMVGAKD